MILVVGAMHEELSDITKHPIVGITVLQTGIGKVNAALQLSKYLATHQVDAIYNLGFAGASNHYQVNDVVMINQSRYHDFDLTFFGYAHGQVPGMPEVFTSNPLLLQSANEKLNDMKKGELFTGDYFMTAGKENPFVVDMEGAALYHVAHHYQVPIISIKVISDILGMNDHKASYKAFEASQGAKALLNVYLKLFEGGSL